MSCKGKENMVLNRRAPNRRAILALLAATARSFTAPRTRQPASVVRAADVAEGSDDSDVQIRKAMEAMTSFSNRYARARRETGRGEGRPGRLDAFRPVARQNARRAQVKVSNTKYCKEPSVPAVVIRGLAEHKVTLGAPLCPCRNYVDKAAEAKAGAGPRRQSKGGVAAASRRRRGSTARPTSRIVRVLAARYLAGGRCRRRGRVAAPPRGATWIFRGRVDGGAARSLADGASAPRTIPLAPRGAAATASDAGYWNCPCVPMRERKECHCMLFLTEDNGFAGDSTEMTMEEVDKHT